MAALVGVGTSHGLAFELDAQATLGRGESATIIISDPLVSSRHAELRREDDGTYRIVDFDSTHGTYVNGARVTDTVLADGDEIIIGATRLRFEDREPRRARATSVSLSDAQHVVRHRLPVDVPDLPRDYERLRIAFEIGQLLAARHDLDDLLRAIVDRAFALVPAERAAILLQDGAALTSRVAVRRDGRSEPMVIPRSILDEVAAQRIGIVSNDASLDRRFGRTASVMTEGVRAALSVPMVHDKELVGIIYLDAHDPGVFGERDLEVLAMVAGQAALAVRTARLRTAVERQERLAAVAQVAAGLAHDFSNLLTMMLGAAELIHGDPAVASHHRANARQIETAAMHATRLTRKLATLARGGPPDLRSLDLAHVLGETRELVQRTLGPRIELALDLTARPCRIMADPIELEQVLLNLAFNARDALSGHGRVTVTLRREPIAGREHAVLLFSDSGPGMTPEVLQRVFEPFFTTKPAGRGTGLGLAVVRRLITESRGRISVESRPGAGTTFRIEWPMTTTISDAAARAPVRSQGELVLVVDDDDAVREVMVAMLERAGFLVAHAASGEEAFATSVNLQALRAVVVDAVLAGGMSGRQFVERVRAQHPGVRVLYVSGYIEAAEAEELTALDARFLAKPFGERDLVARVQAAIHGDAPDVGRRRIETTIRFADGAALLAAYDPATNSIAMPNRPAGDDDRGWTLHLRFDDVGREFRIHGRSLGADRIAFELDDDPVRDLVLAAARGESVPYFRRMEPRFPVRLEVRLRADSGLVIVSHTQDVSARGLMLSTDHALAVGTKVALRIAFSGDEPITLAGRVRSRVKTGPRRGVGIEFEFASVEQREEIAALVQTLAP